MSIREIVRRHVNNRDTAELTEFLDESKRGSVAADMLVKTVEANLAKMLAQAAECGAVSESGSSRIGDIHDGRLMPRGYCKVVDGGLELNVRIEGIGYRYTANPSNYGNRKTFKFSDRQYRRLRKRLAELQLPDLPGVQIKVGRNTQNREVWVEASLRVPLGDLPH